MNKLKKQFQHTLDTVIKCYTALTILCLLSYFVYNYTVLKLLIDISLLIVSLITELKLVILYGLSAKLRRSNICDCLKILITTTPFSLYFKHHIVLLLISIFY